MRFRSGFIPLFLLVLLLSEPVTPQSENNLSWKEIESPVRSILYFIHMLSPSKGYIGGKNLLEYKDGKWQVFNPQPPISGIDAFFVLDEKNIWISKADRNNSSEIYYFNGRVWTKMQSPLANQASGLIFSKDGSGIISGDREIVKFQNGKWAFLPFPDNSASLNVSLCEGLIWLHTNSLKLYAYTDGKWEQHLAGKPVRMICFNDSEGYALTDNELWKYKNKKWRLHSSSFLLKNAAKLSSLDNGEMWACGTDGIIIHYDGTAWKKINSPTHEDLNNIMMLSKSEGWITGTNGKILRYAPMADKKPVKNMLGFQAMKIVSFGADLDDEYGVAIEDFNNDGLQDVYSVCIFSPNRIYINNSKLNLSKYHNQLLFKEEAVYRNISGIVGDTSYTLSTEIYLSAGIADIDNDNDKDFYLCNLAGRNKLFLNDGKGYFRNVTNKHRAVEKSERTNTAVFADVDRDGDSDMFIANEYSTNRLYLNNGNGYFTEVTAEAGLESSGGGMCAAFADLDNDNDDDLYVTNWAKPNLLYRNDTREGKVKFTDLSGSSLTAGETYTKSNGSAFADIDNDGDLDLFVSNRKVSNRLYLNDGHLKFRDVTEDFIGIDTMVSYGVTFADFNLDGYQDLYITNIGNNVLYINQMGKKFIPATFEADALQSGYGTGSAAGDIDSDGDVDLYAANYIYGTSTLFINNINSENYISVKLKGTLSSRDAIGAKLWLYKDSTLQGYREIVSGSGYSSQNSLTAVFGADKESLYTLVVFFPASGITKKMTRVSPPLQLIINEEEELAAFATLLKKLLSRKAADPELNAAMFKSLCVIILFVISFFYGKRKYKWTWKLVSAYYVFISVLFFSQIYIFYYEAFFLSTVLPLTSAIISLSTVHLIYERVVLVKKTKVERQATRDSIARDLHDDLASTLSSSVIYTEALRKSQAQNEENKILLNKINSLLTEASESVTDIVWTVSPQHDTLDGLLLRLRSLITDNCRSKGIELISKDNLDDREIIIPDDIRRNIFLIFKEALNNIIKHSKATEVKFIFTYNSNCLEILLEDNGTGFKYTSLNGNNSAQGHGLRNMLNRAKEIKCDLSINTEPGKGTIIALKKKMA